jgi:hypothetical protein
MPPTPWVCDVAPFRRAPQALIPHEDRQRRLVRDATPLMAVTPANHRGSSNETIDPSRMLDVGHRTHEDPGGRSNCDCSAVRNGARHGGWRTKQFLDRGARPRTAGSDSTKSVPHRGGIRIRGVLACPTAESSLPPALLGAPRDKTNNQAGNRQDETQIEVKREAAGQHL